MKIPRNIFLILTLIFMCQPAYGEDHTKWLQNQIDKTPVGGLMHLPAAIYNVTNIVVDKPITIEGDGNGTVLSMIGHEGYLLDVRMGGYKNHESHNEGVNFRNLTMTGDGRRFKTGAIKVADLDHATFENLNIESFNGSAFYVQSSFRESVLKNIHTRYCGNVTDAVIDVGHHSAKDATNNIFLSDIFSVYSFGKDIRIGNAPDDKPVRHIYLNRIFVHGVVKQEERNVYQWSSDELQTLRVSIENAVDVKLNDVFIGVAGKNNPSMLIGGHGLWRGGSLPILVMLNGVTFQGHYEQTAGTENNGVAVRIVSGNLITITQSTFLDHPRGSIAVAPLRIELKVSENWYINTPSTLTGSVF